MNGVIDLAHRPAQLVGPRRHPGAGPSSTSGTPRSRCSSPALIAIPLGLAIGHTGRGRFFVVNLAGAARAIPSLGLLYLMVLWLFPKLTGDSAFLVPSLIVLIVLAIPPLMAGAYAGVEGVDPAARDAAKGMGMTGVQVLGKVEVPNALPLIFSGFRSATLQVIATATLAAVAGTGGLGRFLIDGQKIRDYPQMAGGALLVARPRPRGRPAARRGAALRRLAGAHRPRRRTRSRVPQAVTEP